jgi:UDP-glucose 4-epimerase
VRSRRSASDATKPLTSCLDRATAQGFTNLEVVETARRVTGHPIPHTIGPRRPGDPAVLVASSDVIRHELGWKPRYPTLEQIISSAWEWHSRNPNGYTGWSRALEE